MSLATSRKKATIQTTEEGTIMKRQVEMYEVSFEYHFMLFATQADAAAAASALSRGAYVSAACNPSNPQTKIDLAPIAPTLRRVFVPVSERACIGAFGVRLKPADRRLIEAAGNLTGITGGACRDACLAVATRA